MSVSSREELLLYKLESNWIDGVFLPGSIPIWVKGKESKLEDENRRDRSLFDHGDRTVNFVPKETHAGFSAIAATLNFIHIADTDPLKELAVLKFIMIREGQIIELRNLCADRKNHTIDGAVTVVEILAKVRQTTIAVAEAIELWRISDSSHCCRPFIFHKDDYLLRMVCDLDFLSHNSWLSDILGINRTLLSSNPLMASEPLTLFIATNKSDIISIASSICQAERSGAVTVSNWKAAKLQNDKARSLSSSDSPLHDNVSLARLSISIAVVMSSSEEYFVDYSVNLGSETSNVDDEGDIDRLSQCTMETSASSLRRESLGSWTNKAKQQIETIKSSIGEKLLLNRPVQAESVSRIKVSNLRKDKFGVGSLSDSAMGGSVSGFYDQLSKEQSFPSVNNFSNRSKEILPELLRNDNSIDLHLPNFQHQLPRFLPPTKLTEMLSLKHQLPNSNEVFSMQRELNRINSAKGSRPISSVDNSSIVSEVSYDSNFSSLPIVKRVEVIVDQKPEVTIDSTCHSSSYLKPIVKTKGMPSFLKASVSSSINDPFGQHAGRKL